VIKKLTRHGNSLALVIDKPILELLNIDRDTPLEITTDGRSLIITPSRQGDRRSTLAYFLKTAAADYGPVLAQLDD
jgi:antitoxin component of MazEF toxin-antitoxin module